MAITLIITTLTATTMGHADATKAPTVPLSYKKHGLHDLNVYKIDGI